MELLKDKLFETISKYVKDYETSFGYIIPGHGMKGKQVAINTDEELVAMYNFHKKKCILLDSLYMPPNKPFFGKNKNGDTVSVSPGKRISLRSECINQLDKWNQLKERGVTSTKSSRKKLFKI